MLQINYFQITKKLKLMKKILLMAVLLVFTWNVQAQYYYISHMNAGHNPGSLNTDAEYPVGQGLPTGWTNLLGTSASPSWTTDQTIPFSFSFNGASVSKYKVSTTGILTFDLTASTPPGSTPATLPNSAIPNKSVVIWGIQGTGSNDFIVSKTFGSSPNRQHWIMFASYSAPGSNVWTYWSIVLEESTNKIYIVDQRTGNGNATLSLGIQIDPTTATMVSGSPSISPSAGTDASPADNSYYEFAYGSQPDWDIALTSLTIGSGNGLATLNANNDLSGTIQNNGAQTINSVDLNYQIDGGATVIDHVTGLNITSGGTYNFTHATPWIPTSGGGSNSTVDFSVTNLNGNTDVNPGDNSLSQQLMLNLGISATKYVLLEEFTTVPCGFCPDGMLVVEDILNNQNNVIATAAHAGFGTDGMTVTAASELAAAFTNAAPTAVIDRTYFEGEGNVAISRSIWAAKVSELLNQWSPVNVMVNGNYNGGTANVTVSADFTDYAAAGNLRLGLIIVEDSVTGSGSGFDQHSYYYNQNGHPFYHVGTFNGSYATIPGYVHKNVLRDALPDIWGANGVISNPQPSDHFSKDFNNVDLSAYDPDQVYLIGFIAYYNSSDPKKRQVLNSFEVKLSNLAGVGINPQITESSMTLYPNPAKDLSIVSLDLKETATVQVFLTDLSGRTVKEITHQKLAKGNHKIGIDVNGLANGLYMVNSIVNNQLFTRKLIVNH